jgi:hypothetical protein
MNIPQQAKVMKPALPYGLPQRLVAGLVQQQRVAVVKNFPATPFQGAHAPAAGDDERRESGKLAASSACDDMQPAASGLAVHLPPRNEQVGVGERE